MYTWWRHGGVSQVLLLGLLIHTPHVVDRFHSFLTFLPHLPKISLIRCEWASRYDLYSGEFVFSSKFRKGSKLPTSRNAAVGRVQVGASVSKSVKQEGKETQQTQCTLDSSRPLAQCLAIQDPGPFSNSCPWKFICGSPLGSQPGRAEQSMRVSRHTFPVSAKVSSQLTGWGDCSAEACLAF